MLRAEGLNESMVLEAEARKRSTVLQAQADSEARGLEAEAEALALVKQREAEARGFQMLKTVFADGSDESKQLLEVLRVLKASEVSGQLAQGQATKLFLPADLSSLFGLLDRRDRGGEEVR